MLKIILCDDDPFILRLGAEKIDELTASRKWDAKVVGLALDSNELISLLPEDVVYLEAQKNVSHGITYHTVSGSVITIIGTLDEEQKKLGEGFVRAHRSYLVNGRHILRMKDGFLKLSNQQEIPCSFRMRSEVKKWITSTGKRF